MKKLYFCLLFLSITSWSFGQIINIPDANFKHALTSTNCAQLPSPPWMVDVDSNNDGEIQVSEAANVLKLDVSTNAFNTSGNINNLDGLQYFINLRELNCGGNSIVNLDVSSFSTLVNLECSYNQLTNLNVSGLTNLEDLRCSKNQLTQLNLIGLTNLKLVYCIYNNLTQIDLSGLSALENFQCDVNQISSLTLGNNTAMKVLSVAQNVLTSLDLQSVPNLEALWATSNAITALNFNGLNKLNSVEVISNNLATIDLSQAPLVNVVHCDNNPNLTTINVRNNYLSFGDPDLLFFPFRFDSLPNLSSICMDDGEQDYLIFTNYNANGNVQVFGGPNCDIPLEISTNGTSDFDLKNNVVLYPNPTEHSIKIETRAGLMIQSVTIYNPLGQTVKIVSSDVLNASPTIDVTDLKTGTYFMEILSNRGKTTKKFVKL